MIHGKDKVCLQEIDKIIAVQVPWEIRIFIYFIFKFFTMSVISPLCPSYM